MRLFIAIDPPDEIREEIAALCRGLDGARWIPAGQLHVTLRFLGETDPTEASRIGEALESIQEPAFSAGFTGMGRFPPRRSPRVIWVGLEPEEPLVALHARIEQRLREIGIVADEKSFLPHLTIARLRDGANSGAIDQWLERWSSFRAGPFPVSRFFLYSSLLGPGGAQHRKERSYDLKAGNP